MLNFFSLAPLPLISKIGKEKSPVTIRGDVIFWKEGGSVFSKRLYVALIPLIAQKLTTKFDNTNRATSAGTTRIEVPGVSESKLTKGQRVLYILPHENVKRFFCSRAFGILFNIVAACPDEER